MKKGLVFFLALAMVLSFSAAALATNGYQLIGIGQLQKSMGGAVTAAPRDAMTAITNPAGMSRIGSRADFSMEAFMPVRSVDFTGGGLTGGEKTEGGTDMYGIPAIGWTAPTSREGLYFGGGMYGTSGLGVDYGEVTSLAGANLDGMLAGFGMNCNGAACNDVKFDGHSAIMFWKMAPTLAWNINEQASVGFSLNLDYQSVAITQKFLQVPFWDNPASPTTAIQQDIIFDLGRGTSQFGYGFTLGGLYDINPMVTIGAMYSSKQSFSEAEFRVGSGDIAGYNGAVGLPGTYKLDLEYPPQLAIGVAIRPIENLLVAVDFKQIYWSETHDKVAFSGPAGSFNPSFNPTGSSTSTELNFGWEDQTVYALGVVYTVNSDLDISAGYNQGEAPIDEADVFNNLVFPAIVETHYTLGADYKLGSHWGVGLTYMKAKSEEITGTGDVPAGMQAATPYTADSGVNISLEEDSYGMQLSYRF